MLNLTQFTLKFYAVRVFLSYVKENAVFIGCTCDACLVCVSGSFPNVGNEYIFMFVDAANHILSKSTTIGLNSGCSAVQAILISLQYTTSSSGSTTRNTVENLITWQYKALKLYKTSKNDSTRHQCSTRDLVEWQYKTLTQHKPSASGSTRP